MRLKAYKNIFKRLRPLLFWLCLLAGVTLQFVGPRLTIEDHMFVIPASYMTGSKNVDPAELVEREKRMQILSAIVTLTGAIGLAFQYRALFMKQGSL
jgi:hypothetical protein